MLDRLKSLPLTILLTILIWMYAESQVNSAPGEATLTVPDVPVWISGSPRVLSHYQVTVEPQTVEVKIVGPVDRVEQLRSRPDGNSAGIAAYLDIGSDDRPLTGLTSRHVRLLAPPGVTISGEAPLVYFRLTETKPAP